MGDQFSGPGRVVYLCGACIAGVGGECHTPECALFLNRAPDIPVTWDGCPPFRMADDRSAPRPLGGT